MKQMLSILSLAILSLVCMQTSAAVKVVECEDEEGNRSFQSTCPPGSSLVNEKKIPTGDVPPPPLVRESETDEAGSANIKATLYYIPECGPCDEVREFFQLRKIPLTEKNVSDDIEIQNELKELRGTLKVPATVVGEKVITGYNRSELLAALEAAGQMTKEEGEKAETEPETGTGTE